MLYNVTYRVSKNKRGGYYIRIYNRRTLETIFETSVETRDEGDLWLRKKAKQLYSGLEPFSFEDPDNARFLVRFSRAYGNSMF